MDEKHGLMDELGWIMMAAALWFGTTGIIRRKGKAAAWRMWGYTLAAWVGGMVLLNMFSGQYHHWCDGYGNCGVSAGPTTGQSWFLFFLFFPPLVVFVGSAWDEIGFRLNKAKESLNARFPRQW